MPSNILENDSFYSGIELPHGDESGRFSCFVFVKYLLTGVHVRLDRFEFFPYDRGLDNQDGLALINEFFERNTTSRLTFDYSDTARQFARQQQPITIVHFPVVVADDHETVQKYCTAQTAFLLNSLSVVRDSAGDPFEIAVVRIDRPEAAQFSIRRPYRGNLLTGSLAGEDPQLIQRLMQGAQEEPFGNFLLTLYREAINEVNLDFRLLRLWQVLELVSDAQEYDPSLDLVDENGNPIIVGGKPVKLTSSTAKAYAVMRDFQIFQGDLWESVNVWFGFRSAVAHHGAIANYGRLSRPDVRAWVERGLKILELAGGGNPIIDDLQRAVNALVKTVVLRAHR